MENQKKSNQLSELIENLRELGLDPTADDYLDGPFVKIVAVFFIALVVAPFLYFEFKDPTTPPGRKTLWIWVLCIYFVFGIIYAINDYLVKKDRKAEAEREAARKEEWERELDELLRGNKRNN